MAARTDSEATIQISSIRTTSNGCSVAKRVSRTNEGWRQPSPNIAAIDFGTTNCSLAYVLPGKMPAHGPNMLPFHGTVYRVPTAILFNKDGSVKAFGATARKKYRSLQGEELLEHAYFEQIKMNLQHDEVRTYYLLYCCIPMHIRIIYRQQCTQSCIDIYVLIAHYPV